MKKKLLTAALTGIIAASSFSSALAGQWQQDPANAQWKYLNDAGAYFTNGWQWIDGNADGIAECYYFDANGYCLINTITPDNYMVDANGAWIVNGIIQTQAVTIANTAAQQSTQVTATKAVSGISSAPYDGYTIVVNTNTHKYHSPACSSVKDIKPENLGYSSDSAYLNTSGYEPCKRCH